MAPPFGKKKRRSTADNNNAGLFSGDRSRRQPRDSSRAQIERNDLSSPSVSGNLSDLDPSSFERPSNESSRNIQGDEERSLSQRNRSESLNDSDSITEDDLAELEQQLEDQDLLFALEAVDTTWADELIEDQSLDPSVPEDLELLQDSLETLILNLQVNRSLATSMQEELETLGKLLQQITPEEIEDFVRTLEQAEEVNEALSRPLQSQEIDDADLELLREESEPERQDSMEDLRDLEAELDDELFLTQAEQIEVFLEQISDESIDRILQIEEDLQTLVEQDQNIERQIRELQEKLGILRENDKKSTLSFGLRRNLKKGANYGLIATKYAIPEASTPIDIATTTLAVISFAKSIRHIRNMQKMLDRVQDQRVRDLIQYAIRQKSKKAAKKGLATAQVGFVGTGHSAARGLYKLAKGTKGKERGENARNLHDLALRGNVEAAALVRELVGSSNMREALDPINREAGLEIIMSKLAST